MTINETIAEVLRLDELSEDLSPAPWHVSGVDSQDVRDDADEATADAYCSNDATLIAYYRTAAPALAREVQRLQVEVAQAHRAGQEAMRERCMQVCADRRRHHARESQWHDAGSRSHIQADEAKACADAIERLEVE